MTIYTITLKREGIHGFFSTQGLGTDALNAMLSIPGVINPEIVKELETLVELTYEWNGHERFMHTGEHFHKFGLARADNE